MDLQYCNFAISSHLSRFQRARQDYPKNYLKLIFISLTSPNNFCIHEKYTTHSWLITCTFSRYHLWIKYFSFPSTELFPLWVQFYFNFKAHKWKYLTCTTYKSYAARKARYVGETVGLFKLGNLITLLLPGRFILFLISAIIG